MNFRKNSILIIGGGIAVVLLAIALFFLITYQKQYRENQAAFNAARNRLNSLNQRNPFPSSENVTLAGENLERLHDRREALQQSLMRGQIRAEQIEPARFAPMLEETARRIRAKASAASVTLPADPGLGFRDYAAGKLPPNDPKIMERLVIQIRGLEDLIDLAIEAKVQSVDTIARDEFEMRTAEAAPEAPTDVRGRGRGAAPVRGAPMAPVVRPLVAGLPLPEESDQYEVERFVIGFTARESAVFDFLNRLSSRKVNYALVDVSFENTRTDVGRPVDMKARLAALASAARTAQPAMPGVAAPEVRLEDISREERVVSGRDLIRVRAVVDMYRFTDVRAGEGTP
ncbi:MAG TPA: Amuc_1100 family pilus-like protein [Kiritimatiellia bacterium]|nr:Amuc_1100 family pilus-like protein [Kiritimatiellia bacterium]HMO97755.1 Amuc_1100 family pilus-like protein [Kiritimatiellia bacterium]HMP95394.1 Amuc_1100 family pilus-like protein [Kiritimatiellia bacterium]